MKLNHSLYVISFVVGCIAAAGCNDDSGSTISTNDDDHGKQENCTCKGGCDDQGECLDPCDKCNPNQTCNESSQCIDNDPGHTQTDECNNKCKSDQTCVGKKCVNNSEICDPPCTGDRVCEANTCVFKCEVHCGDSCCEANQQCDQLTNECAAACFDDNPTCNGSCCYYDKQVCLENVGCADICDPDTQHACIIPNEKGYCCANDEMCVLETGKCTKDCGEYVNCAGNCCKSGEICYKENPDDLNEVGSCKKDCTDSQTRCGEDKNLCCDNDTQICIFNKCVVKGTSCVDFNDCAMDEFCEHSSHTCVKASESDKVCEYRPPVGKFSPKVKWRWTEQFIVSTPIVINLTDDNGDGKVNQKDVPEVIFTAHDRRLYAVSGDDGRTLGKSDEAFFNKNDDIGAADIDNDGEIEVLVPTAVNENEEAKAGLYAMVLRKTEDGKYKWHKKYYIHTYSRSDGSWRWSDLHPQFANLDEKGLPEVITSAGVFRAKSDGTFETVCTLNPKSIYYWYDYMNVVADLDQDGNSEIIGESDIFTYTPVSDTDNKCKSLTNSGETGWYYQAVADLLPDDNDPEWPGELKPEIIRVKSGVVSVWKVYKTTGTDGKVVWKQRNKRNTSVPGNRGNGTPTIADFDGDGIKDIGLAGYSHYSVISGLTGNIVWASPTQDNSSEKTGSTVFDFEGDGVSEVVYRDEVLLRIYSGPSTGKDADGDGYPDANVLWSVKNTSGTVIEYPIVVDVDNDGKTEIVIISEGSNDTKGVTVYSDTYNNWVRTRTIWNQHTYHVTNINDDGTVPVHEEANWLTYNNYRQNVQPSGVFNAPDFTADSMDSEVIGCDNIKITAHVTNAGSYGVRPGLRVNFYVSEPNDTTGKNAYIGTANVDTALSPSGAGTAVINWNRKTTLDGNEITVKMPAKVYFHVDEPTSESPNGDYPECHEENNVSTPVKVEGCPEA